MNKCAAVVALCLAANAALGAEDGALSLGVGIHYSEGDYGTGTTTEIISIPFTARYDKAAWTYKVTVPYLRVTGSTAVVPGVGQVGPGASGRRRGTAEATESGLGDVVTSATYAAYYDRASQTGLDVTGKLKLATADADRGLGTGEHDFGFQVDVYKSFDRTTAFAGVGYTFLGSSAALPLNDVLNYTLGASYRIDARDSAGLSYDEREPASSASGPQRELMAFWTRKLDKTLRAQLYLLRGLADGSPDWGAGISIAGAF